MNIEKCQDLYRRLEMLLKEHRLQWVVEQVEEQIRTGKTVSEEIEPAKGGDHPELAHVAEIVPRKSSRRPTSPKDKFLRRLEYTPCEQLELLISATEHAVVDVGEIGSVFWHFVRTKEQNFTKVQFVSEEETVSSTTFEFGESSERLPAVHKLRALLAQLKKEVKAHAH
jgi:hypothetical protein